MDEKYVIVRTYSAGCFAGYLESRDGKEAVLTDYRRLWFWDGAATLSELATLGTANPDGCKFPARAKRIVLTEAIEILDVDSKAQRSIEGVPPWTRH